MDDGRGRRQPGRVRHEHRYGTTTPVVNSLVTAHSVQLTGLDPRRSTTSGSTAPTARECRALGDVTFTHRIATVDRDQRARLRRRHHDEHPGAAEGAVSLATTGTVTDEFDGTTLDPATWTVGSWSGTPSATVAGGALTVTNSTYVKSQATFSRETLSGRVTLTDGANAHFGFATASTPVTTGSPIRTGSSSPPRTARSSPAPA